MAENTRPPGKTTIAPNVLLTIARLAAMEISGVNQMSQAPSNLGSIFKCGQAEGVRIEVEENRVYADLYMILDHDVNVREVSRQVQQAVARSIVEMVGMEIGRVNVHIENIYYPQAAPAEA
jgi:uncharacterized alkaline shock family protein YloU